MMDIYIYISDLKYTKIPDIIEAEIIDIVTEILLFFYLNKRKCEIIFLPKTLTVIYR